jgi:hypothetical protein
VKPTAFGGADTAVELAPGTTLTPYALAVADGCEPFGDAPAEPATSRTTANPRTTCSRMAAAIMAKAANGAT